MAVDRLQRCNFKCWDYANRFYDIRYVEGRGFKLYDPVLEEKLQPPNNVLKTSSCISFADYLYDIGEWEASLKEYRKELCLRDTESIYMRMGSAYWVMGSRESARDYLCRVDNDTGRLFVGITWLEEREVDSALYYLQGATSFADDVGKLSCNLDNMAKKSPVLAGFMSTLLPGSGRVYSGRAWDGIFSFLLVTGLFAISYEYYREERPLPNYTFLSLASLFYLGDIYGSIKSANEYNKRNYDMLVLDFRHNFHELF